MEKRHRTFSTHISFSSLLLLGLFALVQALAKEGKQSADFIDPRIHDVVELTDSSFKSRVEQKRLDSISFIMLCSTISRSTKCKETVQGIWNEVAKELHGMALVAAINCYTNSELCNKINPDPTIETKEPTVVVFPPLPQDPFISQRKLSSKSYKSLLSKLYPHNEVITITQENKYKFLSDSIQLPKAIFFLENNKKSDKIENSVVLKILAHEFLNKVQIGLVDSAEIELLNQWNIKSFPSLKIIQNNGKEVKYEDDDFSYYALHNWINIYAETFAINTVETGPSTTSQDQPWKYDKIPELTEASHKKICFKNSKGICVIYLKKGGPLDDKEIELLDSLKSQYDSDSNYRSTKFHWMWLNIEENPAFEQLFGEHEYPSLVVLNPYKRKRFFGLPNDVVATKDSITGIMEKVLGGDAQFKHFANLPPFNRPDKGDEL